MEVHRPLSSCVGSLLDIGELALIGFVKAAALTIGMEDAFVSSLLSLTFSHLPSYYLLVHVQ